MLQSSGARMPFRTELTVRTAAQMSRAVPEVYFMCDYTGILVYDEVRRPKMAVIARFGSMGLHGSHARAR